MDPGSCFPFLLCVFRFMYIYIQYIRILGECDSVKEGAQSLTETNHDNEL